MSKISLITKREYLSRVKKKSFIVMTILGPVLMAALIIAPVWFATLNDESEKNIAVIDKSGKFKKAFEDTENFKFKFINDTPIDSIKNNFQDSQYQALLFIPDTIIDKKTTLYSDKQPGLNMKMYIKNIIKQKIETEKLKHLGINKEQIDTLKANVDIQTVKWTEGGKEESSSAEITIAIGFIAAIIIYIFIFMYGAQVMRGVIEEKTNRVVEVLVSSVKPFQLMAGKIIGIAGVALTQFLLWGILTAAIVIPLQAFFMPESISETQNIINNNGTDGISEMQQITENSGELGNILDVLSNFNWGLLITVFIFFFIGGYLLYASLFAAIGSAVDNETDTQQFMLPVTIPLILAFVAAQTIIRFPDGDIAFWFSIIPFTSPIIMPVRVAADAVQMWEIILSAFLLIAAFVGTVWLAAKIYKVGILMYGKKPSYKEIWKWVKYK